MRGTCLLLFTRKKRWTLRTNELRIYDTNDFNEMINRQAVGGLITLSVLKTRHHWCSSCES